MRYLIFLFIFFFITGIQGVWASCPYSIKDASVMLTLPEEINVKFTSSSMCKQKEYFAERFLDADVEIYKSSRLVGKFYARKITYDSKNLKIILQNAVLLQSELIKEKKYQEIRFAVVDLKKRKISTSAGEIRF